jgi:hypothetical protein
MQADICRTGDQKHSSWPGFKPLYPFLRWLLVLCPLSFLNKSAVPKLSLRAKRSNLFGFKALTNGLFVRLLRRFTPRNDSDKWKNIVNYFWDDPLEIDLIQSFQSEYDPAFGRRRRFNA